jgi:hypothetical protein
MFDNNVRCIVVHPKATILNRKYDLIKIINDHGIILKEISLHLTYKGFDNLIKECYCGNIWSGGTIPSKSFKKSKRCFVENSCVQILLVRFNNTSQIVEIKQHLRDIYNLEKDSLHITDDEHDTHRVYNATFNTNSVDYLNNGSVLSSQSQLTLIKYFNEIKNKDYNNFCVTSSFILEMYGIRVAHDLDYIHINNSQLNLQGINLHDKKMLEFYPISTNEIINNENYHFYFYGFKFLKLSTILEMKKNRNEKKDRIDLNLYNIKQIY